MENGGSDNNNFYVSLFYVLVYVFCEIGVHF
jgi:hypothetical protein